MGYSFVLSIFRIVAPTFAAIDDDTVTAWIGLTDPLVSKKRFGNLHNQALALLTAHRMQLAGVLDSSEDDALDGVGNLASGKWRHVASYSEGQVSIGFNHDRGDLNTEGDTYYGLTEYGVQFLQLRRIRIVSIVSAAERRGR